MNHLTCNIQPSVLHSAESFGEPWRRDQSLGSEEYGNLFDVDGNSVVPLNGGTLAELAREDRIARRIAACVNFCEGLTTQFLETYDLKHSKDSRAVVGLVKKLLAAQQDADRARELAIAPPLTEAGLRIVEGGAE